VATVIQHKNMKTTNYTEVIFNQIEKETEKAIMVNLPVSWNSNCHPRSFWFPKSCVKMYKQTMEIATWMVEKMEKENAFHGYRMEFPIAR